LSSQVRLDSSSSPARVQYQDCALGQGRFISVLNLTIVDGDTELRRRLVDAAAQFDEVKQTA
jgi:hypothetical protein